MVLIQKLKLFNSYKVMYENKDGWLSGKYIYIYRFDNKNNMIRGYKQMLNIKQ